MKKHWISAGITLLIFLPVLNASKASDPLTVIIHGQEVISEVPARIENGTTLVPLRVITEYLHQDVQWDPKTNTVTVQERDQGIERLVVQRNHDVFVSEDPLRSETYRDANRTFIFHLQTVYDEAYRGFLRPDPDSHEWPADTKLIAEMDLPFIKDSETAEEGSVSTDFIYARLVQVPYVPQPGQNAPPRKDVLFYLDPDYPDDLFLAVQDPQKRTVWKVYYVKGYGRWFQKEVDLYIWGSRGL